MKNLIHKPRGCVSCGVYPHTFRRIVLHRTHAVPQNEQTAGYSNGVIPVRKEQNDILFRKVWGFTLIEMIVSLGVFSVALLISISAILSVSAAQKKAVALQNAEDNFRFAFEAIAKEIRTGRDFFCDDVAPPPGYVPKDCATGERLLTFQNARGQTISYEYESNSGRLQKTVDRLSTTFLTSGLVHINDFKFYVVGTGAATADLRQPRVTMLLKGTAGVSEAEQVTLRLQTTVSQRRLDN